MVDDFTQRPSKRGLREVAPPDMPYITSENLPENSYGSSFRAHSLEVERVLWRAWLRLQPAAAVAVEKVLDHRHGLKHCKIGAVRHHGDLPGRAELAPLVAPAELRGLAQVSEAGFARAANTDDSVGDAELLSGPDRADGARPRRVVDDDARHTWLLAAPWHEEARSATVSPGRCRSATFVDTSKRLLCEEGRRSQCHRAALLLPRDRSPAQTQWPPVAARAI